MAQDKDTKTQGKGDSHPDDRSGSDCYPTNPGTRRSGCDGLWGPQ
jgi:hypothetical protein